MTTLNVKDKHTTHIYWNVWKANEISEDDSFFFGFTWSKPCSGASKLLPFVSDVTRSLRPMPIVSGAVTKSKKSVFVISSVRNVSVISMLPVDIISCIAFNCTTIELYFSVRNHCRPRDTNWLIFVFFVRCWFFFQPDQYGWLFCVRRRLKISLGVFLFLSWSFFNIFVVFLKISILLALCSNIQWNWIFVMIRYQFRKLVASLYICNEKKRKCSMNTRENGLLIIIAIVATTLQECS